MKRAAIAAFVLAFVFFWFLKDALTPSLTTPQEKTAQFVASVKPSEAPAIAAPQPKTDNDKKFFETTTLPSYPNNWSGEHAPQLTLAVDLDGQGVHVSQAQIINSYSAPQEDLRADHDYRIQLLDRDQNVVAERSFADPRRVHSPLQSPEAIAAGAQAEPHKSVRLGSGSLSVRIPHHPDAISVRVVSNSDGKTLQSHELNKTLAAAPAKASATYNVVKLQGRDDGVGTDLVFVGDGFLASEMSTFIDGVNVGHERLLSWEPMNTYRDSINVFYIEVPSQESGVGLNGEASAKNTAFRTYFNCGNIDRLLCVGDQNNLRAVVQAHVPQYDQAIVLSNSSKYGGAGGWYATASLAPSTGDLVTHEVGHSLTQLADEYDYGSTAAPIAEPSEPNVTINNNSSTVKWQHWIGKSGNFTDTTAVIGLHEGGQYVKTGVWRPTNNSMMRALGQPMYAVNAEAWAKEFYRRSGAVAKFNPETSSLSAQSGQELTFTVIPGLAAKKFKTVWKVNGVIVSNSSATQLLCCRDKTGNYSVTAEVSDDTAYIGKHETNLSAISKTWNVSVSTSGGGSNSDFDHDGSGDDADLDDDNDQMPDSWEVQFGLNSKNASDAALDNDGDGISNLNEYKNNSNPIGLDGGLTRVARDNGLCLTVSNNAISSADVSVLSCASTPSQRWYVNNDGHVKNELSVEHCLDASNSVVALKICDKTKTGQLFNLDSKNSLRLKSTGDAIDYGNNDVIRYAYHGDTNQQWPGIKSYIEPSIPQPDNDNDGMPDSNDNDDDNDGVVDTNDAFPFDRNESLDSDQDGKGNNQDNDDDNDGVTDEGDAFPINSTETIDSDRDGLGNNADTDDDNDSYADTTDSYPLDPSRWKDETSTNESSGGGGGSVTLFMLALFIVLFGQRKAAK